MFCCSGSRTDWDKAYHWDRPLYQKLDSLYVNHFWGTRLCMIIPSATLAVAKVAVWPLVATIHMLASIALCCAGKQRLGQALLFAGSMVFWGGFLAISGYAIFHFGYPPTGAIVSLGCIVGLRVIQQLGLGCAGKTGFDHMLSPTPDRDIS